MADVKSIPDGFQTITPHIIVKNAAEAIEFYKKALGAEEREICNGPDGKSVMHAELKIGTSILMICDEFPDHGAVGPKTIGGTPVTLHVYTKDTDAAFKRAVDAGATAKMPPQDMFWGDRYGQVVDPYGHVWSFATHIKDVTPEEMKKAAEAAFAQGGACSEKK